MFWKRERVSLIAGTVAVDPVLHDGPVVDLRPDEEAKNTASLQSYTPQHRIVRLPCVAIHELIETVPQSCQDRPSHSRSTVRPLIHAGKSFSHLPSPAEGSGEAALSCSRRSSAAGSLTRTWKNEDRTRVLIG